MKIYVINHQTDKLVFVLNLVDASEAESIQHCLGALDLTEDDLMYDDGHQCHFTCDYSYSFNSEVSSVYTPEFLKSIDV